MSNLSAPLPASNPCGSCPYRRDVPSGVWDAAEYEKLPRYDGPMADQPARLFLCHQHMYSSLRGVAHVCTWLFGLACARRFLDMSHTSVDAYVRGREDVLERSAWFRRGQGIKPSQAAAGRRRCLGAGGAFESPPTSFDGSRPPP
jgi:hypothetical protein